MSVKDAWNMVCPNCRRDDSIAITATTQVLLTEDGTDEIGDHEWDDESRCECRYCGRSGKASDFTEAA